MATNKTVLVLDGGKFRPAESGDAPVGGDGGALASATDLTALWDNVMQLYYLHDAGYSPIPDGMFDAFDDQSGVDDTASTGESYDAVNDLYQNAGTGDTDTWTLALDADHGGDLQNNTHRMVIPAASISTSGSRCRVTFNASSGGNLVVDNAAIVERSGSTAAGVTTPTELLFSEASGFSLTASGSITSDWVDFEIDETKDYLLIIDYDADGASYSRKKDGVGDLYYKSGQSYDTADGSGFSTATVTYAISKIEVNDDYENIVLLSEDVTADEEPAVARACVFVEPIDEITINTDLKAYVSRDGGTTWDEVELVLVATLGSIKQYAADVTLTSTGTTMKLKVSTFSTKRVKLHAWGFSWRVE